MSLSALMFSATGNYTLTVYPKVSAIVDTTATTLTASMRADNANADHAPNDFYYLPDPKDATQPLMITYIADGAKWYAGYQFKQQAGTENAQFRPVFWQYGKPFSRPQHRGRGAGPRCSTPRSSTLPSPPGPAVRDHQRHDVQYHAHAQPRHLLTDRTTRTAGVGVAPDCRC